MAPSHSLSRYCSSYWRRSTAAIGDRITCAKVVVSTFDGSRSRSVLSTENSGAFICKRSTMAIRQMTNATNIPIRRSFSFRFDMPSLAIACNVTSLSLCPITPPSTPPPFPPASLDFNIRRHPSQSMTTRRQYGHSMLLASAADTRKTARRGAEDNHLGFNHGRMMEGPACGRRNQPNGWCGCNRVSPCAGSRTGGIASL